LQKIFNNISTTSNIFAVWWTVGYFEVVDETVRPQRLRAEVGRAEGRHIRHRFFAILDHSRLQLYSGQLVGKLGFSAGPVQQVVVDPTTIRTWRGPASAWNATVSYVVGDAVVSAGVAYYCIQANTAVVPTNTSFWQPVLQAGMSLEVDTG